MTMGYIRYMHLWFHIYVIAFSKTDHLRTRTEIHVLPIHDRHTRALFRNTKYWTIDSPVCLYRWLFIDAVKPRGCISWPRGASIGLHGVPGCSSRQSCALQQFVPQTEGTALFFESEWLL